MKWLNRNPTTVRKVLASLVVLIGFMLCMWTAGIIGREQNVKYLQFFWILHPEYIFFGAILLVAGAIKNNPQQHQLAWAPSLTTNPVPIPSHSNPDDNDIKTWWRGTINLFVCLLLLKICAWFTLLPPTSVFFIKALQQYLYFLIFVVSAMNSASGLIRIFNIKVPDATRFVFLAASPLDVWQRGSSYLYNFMFQLVFMPVFRASKKIWLTVIVTFFATIAQIFLFHDIGVRGFYGIIFPEFRTAFNLFPEVFKQAFIFGGAWLGIIIFYQLVLKPQFIKRQMLGQSWLPILVTHALVLLLTVFFFQ